MYNGNGGGYTNIGGVRVKSLYLYIVALIAVVIAVYFVTRFLNTSLVMHFSAFAGVLLLIANVRELLGNPYGQRSSTALLNVMVGGALICAWLSQLISVFLWIPALLLVGIATPLIFGRASVYTAYLGAARSAADGVRRTLVR